MLLCEDGHMTLQGVDAASPVPVSVLTDNGKVFVGRYVSGGSWKDITQAEVQAFMAAGIDIVIYFETSGQDFVNGFAQGVADAKTADAELNSLGMTGCPVYFTVDMDTTNYAGVASYLQGAASVIGVSRVGIYGGLAVISHARAQGVATYFAQTYAWSDGALDPAVHLYQYQNGVTLNGVTVDLERTVVSDIDFGQFKYKETPMNQAQAEAVATVIMDLAGYVADLHRLPESEQMLQGWVNHLTPLLVNGDIAGVQQMVQFFAQQPEASNDEATLLNVGKEVANLKADIAALQAKLEVASKPSVDDIKNALIALLGEVK